MHDWHVHGIDHDHDHGPLEPLEDNPLWQADHIDLISVGIDIGSAGTQVAFSKLRLRRMGEDLTSRYVVTEREPLYHSGVSFTPYQSETRIDEKAVWSLIADAYVKSGLEPGRIDAGVVLLTGEAIRRENARAIGEVLASQGGEFVCAAAGHNMESLLAAFGSGAALASHEKACRILNIDIGGGTTKIAVVEKGKVVETAALHTGGRLAVLDEERKLQRLDPGAVRLAAMAGLDWRLGERVEAEDFEKVADLMARLVLEAVSFSPRSPELEELFLTPAPVKISGIGGVMFSGGVGEYVYDRELRDFSDLGRLFGRALRARIDRGELPWPLLPAGECIRATVIGASSYSLQVSGNTVFLDGEHLLPKKNLQVLHPPCDLTGEIDAQAVEQAIRAHFQRFDLVEGEAEAALSFHWRGEPEFRRIEPFLRGIKNALPLTLSRGKPLYLVLDADLGQTIGSLLREDPAVRGEILVIDGILLQDFDFIDLGRMLRPSMTVPVTVKTLIFRQDRHDGVDYG